MEYLLRATANAEKRHFWYRGFRAFVTPLLRYATAGRSNIQLLDCGCGTGANLAWLGTFGRVYGFDLTAIGLQIAREGGRARVARATVTAVPFPTAFFDIVTSFDVLYALDDDNLRTAIAEMYRVLKPGGFAIVNVAAMEMLRGDHSVLGHEVRRFSSDELRKWLTAGGLDIVRLTYTNITLFVPLALVRAWQRFRGLRAESEGVGDFSVPPAPVNALMKGLLLLESAWIRRFDAPVGSSLLCLARKPLNT